MDTDETPLLFKAQLFALTGVQPERQKVMLKGATLKDTDWGNIKLKDVCIVNIIKSCNRIDISTHFRVLLFYLWVVKKKIYQ